MNTMKQKSVCRRWADAWVGLVATGLMSFGAVVWAEESGDASSAEPGGFFEDTMLFENVMDDLRGGDVNTTISIENSQDLTASVEQVSISADSILTGTIEIGDHAFDNFNGVGAFNLVTGNNNAVNSAIEVTFTLE
jgi:hypothetical protein